MSQWRAECDRSLRRIAAATTTTLLALGVLGCAGQQTVVRWNKEGATAEDLEEARRACLVQPGAAQVQIGADRVEAEVRANAFVRCMEARGWTWSTELVDAE